MLEKKNRFWNQIIVIIAVMLMIRHKGLSLYERRHITLLAHIH